uniref:SFRICE_005060 n=1 Tax=Spodoptera frugiperda TaxID=7108 RepID=A0A2H1WAS4_SPOFR
MSQNGRHGIKDDKMAAITIDPKPCNPRTLQKPKRGGGYPKVFLGGLPSNVTETDLRVFFGRYGKVMEVVIMYDQEKKKSRVSHIQAAPLVATIGAFKCSWEINTQISIYSLFL